MSISSHYRNGLEHNLVNDLLELEDGRIFMACNDGSLALMVNDRIVEATRTGAVINGSFLYHITTVVATSLVSGVGFSGACHGYNHAGAPKN